jgi:hypothetical protein
MISVPHILVHEWLLLIAVSLMDTSLGRNRFSLRAALIALQDDGVTNVDQRCPTSLI